MKTVGYVLAEFPVLSETFVGTEMRAMQLRGHRIVPITFKRSERLAQPVDAPLESVTQYLTSVSAGACLLTAILAWYRLPGIIPFLMRQKGLPRLSLWWQALHLAVVVRREGVEHLHAHFALAATSLAIVAARICNVPVSFVGHGFDIYATPADLRLKLASADFAIAVCEQTRIDLQQVAPRSRLHTMHCGVDLNRFRSLASSPSASSRFLFVGRLCEKKGVDTLLQALSRVNSFQPAMLDVVGDGPLLATLQNQAKSLGIASKVNFLGSQTSEWIIENANDYCALVTPFRIASNGDRDTGPLVLKEAMALGLPVITSALMGCDEIVAHDSGWKVPPDDVMALAVAMRECLGLTSFRRDQLVSAARKRVEALFSADVCVATLSVAIEQGI